MFVTGQEGVPARLSWPCTSFGGQLPSKRSTPRAACADQAAQRGRMAGRRGWQGRLQAWAQAPGCAQLTADACCVQERGANSDPSLEERSYYIDYIYRDLEPWKEKGITEVPFNTSAFQAHGHHVCRLLHWGAPAADSCVACCPVTAAPCTWVLVGVLL